jgi:3-hydroxyacyl-CoA dehydrogenase
MILKGITSFFKVENGKSLYYDIASQSYKAKPGADAFIVMKNFANETVWKNSACRTYHLGEDVIGLEWYTKMGSIGGEVLDGPPPRPLDVYTEFRLTEDGRIEIFSKAG